MLYTRRLMLGSIAIVATAGLAVAAGPLPKAQNQGDVTFLSGGVSDEEQQAIRDQASDYNLWVTMTRPDGAYLADVDVTLENASGDQVLKTTTKGPALLADLPEGRYTLHADAEDRQAAQRTVDIPSEGQTRIYLALDAAE